MNAPATSFAPRSLPIAGMTCASCVGRVERALRAVPGVASADVNLATERADVRFSGPVEGGALVGAIRDAGYDVTATRIELEVEGMTCASCVGRVERALKAVPGVAEAAVNLATERATVTGSADAAALIAAVEGAGYDARERHAAAGDDCAAARRDAEAQELRRDMMIAGGLTLPVFVLEMGSHMVPPVHHLIMTTIGMQTSWLIQFALTTLVMAFPGIRFYAQGFPGAGARRARHEQPRGGGHHGGVSSTRWSRPLRPDCCPRAP
jgi:copper ion binding protein